MVEDARERKYACEWVCIAHALFTSQSKILGQQFVNTCYPQVSTMAAGCPAAISFDFSIF